MLAIDAGGKRSFHHDGKAGEQPNPNNHWQNGGSANRGVQPMIVVDGVEFRDDCLIKRRGSSRLIFESLGEVGW